MRIVPVMATKGGVGKSRVCTSLARALKSKNLKVGLLDVDWVAPNLHVELGISKDHGLVLNCYGVGDTIQPIISPEGFPLVSSSFIFPADQAVSMDEESTIKDIIEITTPGVIDWGDLDYLIMDTPPTTAKFVQAALQIKDLHGVVLVSQPATTSLADLLRTISLLKDLQVPILGLIGNQVYVVCPHGDKVNLYDLHEEDIKNFSESQGVPYLGSIPHVIPSMGFPSLDGIVDSLVAQSPIYLKPTSVSKLPYKLLLALVRRRRRKDED